MIDLRGKPSRRVVSSGPCAHQIGCQCRRPVIGRALVHAVGVQLLMGMVAIASGATTIGVVACGAMAACTWLFAVAEIIAFYRVGLPTAEPARVGRTRAVGNPYHPGG